MNLGFIPARGGSKGLPNKNIKMIGGKPLIAWTINAARASKYVDDLIVSTDSTEIAEVAETFGVPTPSLRPPHLATDEASVIDAILYEVDKRPKHYDNIILLQPTSPLRTARDIDAVVEVMRAHNAPSVITVSNLSKPENFLVTCNGNSEMSYFKRSAGEEKQSLKMLNGAVYIADIAALRQHRSFMMPGAISHEIPLERAWDIDSAYDFIICELLLPFVLRGAENELRGKDRTRPG